MQQQQDFKHLTDTELESALLGAVELETRATTRVLHLLAEAERRRLYSKSCPSLFEYCVRVLKYSNAAAQLRIDAMRALKVEPAIEAKLIDGTLNISTVSKAQFLFRHEASQGRAYTTEEKRDFFRKIENRSVDEVKVLIAEIAPEAIPQEKRRVLTPEKTELKVVLDAATIQKLEKLKALLSHQHANLSDGQLIQVMADALLKKLDPEQWKTREKKDAGNRDAPRVDAKETKASGTALAFALTPANPTNLTKPTIDSSPGPLRQQKLRSINPAAHPALIARLAHALKNTAPIPRAIKKQVWIRDRGRCAHPSCASSRFIEYHHILAREDGGLNTPDNLQLLCYAHHREVTERRFGKWAG